MALTTIRLQRKQARKTARRAKLRKRRRYLLRRYGDIVGARVYVFERGFRNKRVGSKPAKLRAQMTQTDRYGKSPVRSYIERTQTTGDIHRARRKARSATLR